MIYTSQYPPAYNSTYIKATTKFTSPELDEWHTFNPATSLTGNWNNNQWLSNAATNQRLHVDLGSAKIIKRIYFENSHFGPDMATWETTGAKNFTFWGSNTAGAFTTLTYGTDTNWTQLTTSISQWAKHVMSDVADPQYATVTNTTAYRYYAFKFADNWGGSFIGARRIELQTGVENTYPFPSFKHS